MAAPTADENLAGRPAAELPPAAPPPGGRRRAPRLTAAPPGSPVAGVPAIDAPDADLAGLQAFYRIEDPAVVGAFVAAHPFLRSLLIEAGPAIRNTFLGAPVVLELFSDPDDGSDLQLLAAIAPQTMPDEAIEQYDRLLWDWWLAHKRAAQGRLALILKYC